MKPRNPGQLPGLTSFTCLAAAAALAQYTPPPPPAPFPGFINEALRKDDPYMNRWDFGGQFRERFEYHAGYGIAGTPGSLDFRDQNADTINAYHLHKLRFRAGYTDSWFSVLTEGRSSLASGDERIASAAPVRREGDGPEADSIDLHQAFVTLGNHKEFPLSLKVGRQELSYGEERLLGAFAWNNIGRVFDAAKLRWQNSWFGADFFASRLVIPEDGRFNVSNDYEWFSGFYATSPKIPKHSLDVYGFARNATPQAARAVDSPQAPLPSARDVYTLGARLKSAPGRLGSWDYFVDLAGQLGNYADPRAGAPAGRLDHEAWMAVFNGGYTFSDLWGAPRLGLEYAFGSGDGDPQDGSHGTFDNLYPTNHKFYGYGDFVSLQNIHNLRPMLTLKPTARLSVALEGHLFWLADTADSFYNVGGVPRGGAGPTPGTGYGVNPDYGGFVGAELDVIAGYAVTRFAQIEAGYAHFFTGSYVNQSLSDPAFGSRAADFFYLQAVINF